MKAHSYLELIEKYDRMIDSRKYEIMELRDGSGFVANFPADIKVQTTKRADRTENMIIGGMEREGELQEEICDIWRKRQAIIKTIEELNAREYGLLYYLYVERIGMQEAADRFDRSYNWAALTKKNALHHLQKLLDEREICDKRSMVTGHG